MNHTLFQLLDDSNQVAGLEWLDDHAICFHAVGVFGPVRLQLANGQQDWSFQGSDGGAHLLADFKTGVALHVYVKDDDVRFMLRNFLDCGSAVTYSDDLIACIRKDLLAHILGCHAVISE